MMQTKDQDVAVLGNCLRYNEELKEKAACAHKLGQIYFLTDDKSESGFKYIRMAYEFQPSNTTYIESVCARSSLEISKHMFDGAFSEAEAEETLYSLSIIDKCSSHNFFTLLLIARTAYNLGFFYYNKEQNKHNLENAKKCFSIAHDLKPDDIIYSVNLAAVHYHLNEVAEAIPLYLKCLEAEFTVGFSKSEKASCAGTLGLISLENKASKPALDFCKLAHQLDQSNGYYMNNLASAYFVNKQYDNAKYYFSKCTQAELTEHFTESTRENCHKGLEMIGEMNHEL